MSKKNKATAKVLQMPTQAPSTLVDLASHRSRAAMVALDRMIDRLTAANTRMKKAWKKSLGEAIKAHEGGRDHSEFSGKAVAGAAECNRLAERIAVLRDAAKECLGAVDRAMASQGDLFDPGKGGEIDGMGWSSEGTRQAAYSCLLAMSQGGEKLDPYQVELLADLAGAGLEALEFGLDASEAVEADGAEEPAAEEGEGTDDFDFD